MLAALLGAALAAAPFSYSPTFWGRTAGGGEMDRDVGAATGDPPAWRVRYRAADDWAVTLGEPIRVLPGAVLEMDLELRVDGDGEAGLGFVVRRGPEVVNWEAGRSPLRQTGGWRKVKATVVAGNGVTSLEPRVTGYRAATVWIGKATLRRRSVPVAGESAQKPIRLRNSLLEVTLNPSTLETTTKNRRTGRTWRQRAAESAALLSGVETTDREATLRMVRSDGLPTTVRLKLDAKRPEATWEVLGEGALGDNLAIPGAFEAAAGSRHVVPMNMGIEFAANDAKIEEHWLHGFGGHGLSMAWYGLLTDGSGVLTSIERSDDFIVAFRRRGGIFEAQPFWMGEKGQMGYARRLRTTFYDRADHVTLALGYREEAKRKGLWVPLVEKNRKNPNVVRVARGANVWTWGDQKAEFAADLHAAGFRNVLWSGGGTPAELKAIRALGFVTSRYDIYQDVMDPAKLSSLPWVHPDWTTGAWPDKLVRKADGDWERGWVVQDRAGDDVPCAVCCDLEALDFARERIGNELKTHPFEARFIDTTTASAYRECYDPRHPVTRAQSRKARMELLDVVTEFGLVTGSETGHEASVPHLVFFEGMMSLGPYRVPDAGTNPPKPYDTLPENVLTFQIGSNYRVPLWQLVFGDCTVSTWYWGDFNNKHLGTWKTRDLWNALYGTPPMYFTDRAGFAKDRAEFIRSYRLVMPVVERVAMAAMTGHRFLTTDRTVQRSEWSNGVRVTVNFGDRAQSVDGKPLAAGGLRVEGGAGAKGARVGRGEKR